jgi:diguanylate cyclase (GGDEF)-like protein/PAS domain S-box-containing protein
MSVFDEPETYRDILDGLQIGVSVLDLEKKIVFWSDGAEQIAGYTRMEVLGHSCAESILLHCNQSSCEMCAGKCPMATALHDTKAVEGMSFIHHKAGHWIPVHTWAIPLRDKRGSIIGIIQTFEDDSVVAAPEPVGRSSMARRWLDDLTGLPTQTMMLSHLHTTLRAFNERQIPFGIVCLEACELSQFRARYGQEACKSILQVLARALRNTVWPTDFVGHWSESRFLVILSGCTESALQSVCDRIAKMMASATIHWWGEELSVAVSIGITCAAGNDTVDSILQRAQPVVAGNHAAQTVDAVAAAGAGGSSKSGSSKK